MSSVPPGPSVLQILEGPPVVSIDDVIERLKELDAAIGNHDGLKWFSLLYWMVSEQVRDQPPPGGWLDAAWITRLDVIFANFYFTAVSDARLQLSL
jgi:hypothetical protein